MLRRSVLNLFQTVSLPFRIVYKIYFGFIFVLVLVLLYPLLRYYLYKKERFHSAFKLMKFYGRAWLFLVGVRVRVVGKENLIEGMPLLICSNHSSFLDIPCMYSLFNKYFIFTGKKEIEHWPLFNIFYTSGMNILVDRDNKQAAFKSFKKMMEVIDNGNPLVVLPEGTISNKAPQMARFKPGAAILAIQKQIPILPITFTTNWKRMQRKGVWKGKASPGISEVVIHPLLETKGKDKKDLDSIQEFLRNTINEPLKEKYCVK